MSAFYTVGKIVNTHGIRGEVRVITTSDFAEDRYKLGKELYFFQTDSSEGIPLTIRSHRQHKNFDLLSFEEHPSINDVEKYKGGLLKVKDTELEALPEGEYYYHEIIGCEVWTDTGEQLGKVKEILAPGANDVWVIAPVQGNKELLIPYIAEVVREVNISEKKITIHPLEGLLE